MGIRWEEKLSLDLLIVLDVVVLLVFFVCYVSVMRVINAVDVLTLTHTHYSCLLAHSFTYSLPGPASSLAVTVLHRNSSSRRQLFVIPSRYQSLESV